MYTQTTNFGEEPFNSNSDFFHVGFQHLFPVGQNFWIGPTAGWVLREANGYAPGTVQYVPELTRWSAGTVMRYIVGKVTLIARAEHVWLETGAIPAPGGSQVSLLSSTTCTNAGGTISNCAAEGFQHRHGSGLVFADRRTLRFLQ